MHQNIILLKIHGEVVGVNKDILDLLEFQPRKDNVEFIKIQDILKFEISIHIYIYIYI